MIQLRIKDFTTKVGSGKTPRGGAEVYQDQGIPLFRSQNVTNEGLLLDDIAYISEEIDEEMVFTRTKPLDVLLNITGASLGRCYYIPNNFVRANVNQHVCIIRPIQKMVISIYLYYLIVSPVGQEQIKLALTGGNRDGLSFEVIRNLSFNIPCIFEQQNIVEYLESKCSKIDASIATLKEMKDKYLSLKKSLINETVCRGLNKNVPLKSSGIDWIGDIPEHWEVKRMKNICTYISRGCTPNYVDEGTIYTMNQATFSSGYIDYTKARFTDKLDFSALVKIDDLLIASTGGGVLGKVVYVDQLKGTFYADSHVSIVRSIERVVNNKFLYYFFKIHFGTINALLAQGSTNQTELQKDELNNFVVPVPPIEEQQSIATYLDTKCSKIDAIVANIESQIEAYTKLKKSLISEVVTGKKRVI